VDVTVLFAHSCVYPRTEWAIPASWSSFTDPWGMEGWVRLVSKQFAQDRYVADCAGDNCYTLGWPFESKMQAKNRNFGRRLRWGFHNCSGCSYSFAQEAFKQVTTTSHNRHRLSILSFRALEVGGVRRRSHSPVAQNNALMTIVSSNDLRR